MPDAITGASWFPTLLGGLLALSGVLVSQLINLWQRAQEQRLNLRREVYLQAAEAMAKIQEYLANFAEATLTPEEHKALLHGVTAALNKVHVAGRLETIKAFDTAGQFFAEQVFRLVKEKIKMSDLSTEIESRDHEAEQLRSRVDGLENLAATLNERSPANEHEWVELGTQYTAALGRAAEVQAERTEFVDQRFAVHRRLIAMSGEATLEFRQYLAQANLALRRELGLPLNEKSYTTMMGNGSERLRRNLAALVDSLDDDEEGHRPT